MAFMQKRRFSFPHPQLAEAQIEPIVQPLYSMATIDDATMTGQRETMFFKYSIGGTTAGLAAAGGTVPATVLHTNMETPGFIASPKVFLATGTRIVLSNLGEGLTSPFVTAGTTVDAAPEGQYREFQSILEILYGTYFRFYVGTKDYLVCPTWMIPGNTGIGGLSAVAISAASGVGFSQQLNASLNTQGKYFSFNDNRILIPSQQNFHTSISAPQATPPDPHLEVTLYSVLDGVFGREVQ
jgi:hypothetical protein